MTPRRSGRDGERGHVAVIVGLGSVALLAITGLALDGGMEAGAFRQAQNAADAGALAAARQVYVNAMSSPQATSDPSTLTPVAQKEVTHNRAQLGWVTSTYSALTAVNSGGTTQSMTADGMGFSFTYAAAPQPTVATSGQTVYVPTSSGNTGQAAVGDISAPAGTALAPVNAHLLAAQTQSSVGMQAPASGGSTASSQIEMGEVDVASQGVSAYVNCWTAQARYTTGQTTTGTPTACLTGGAVPVGVSVTGTLLSSPATGVVVDSNDAPTAKPRMMATSLDAVDGGVTLTSVSANSSNDLYWDHSILTAVSAVNATGVHLSTGSFTADAPTMVMRLRAYIDPKTGQPNVKLVCKPGTVTLTNVLSGTVVTVTVDQSCAATGLSSLGMANVTMPYTQPSSISGASDCSTNSSTGQITCSAQACFLRLVVNANPYNTTVCLGETSVTVSAVPVSIQCSGSTACCASPPCGGGGGGGGGSTPALYPVFTGAVTVAATVPQPTYFLRVLGWSETNPTAVATADVEAVIDEPQAQFTASPFAMPDTATAMQSPYAYERLQVGHTYYLYGSSMQSYNPAPAMPTGWQGQLDTASSHRVGDSLTGVSTLTTTPQSFESSGSYYLEPVFDPVTGVVLYYGEFLPVSGHPNWGTLVNSVPGRGCVVQATSSPGWITFDEGAVSVKLTNSPAQ